MDELEAINRRLPEAYSEETLSSKIERLIANLESYQKANENLLKENYRRDDEISGLRRTLANLANWNDSLRVTIDDYLNERANKADLKLALTSWRNKK